MKKNWITLLSVFLGASACAFGANPQYEFIDLGTLGGRNSYAYAINNNGQIVGRAENPDGLRRAVLFDTTGQGKSIDLGVLRRGSSESCATAINNRRQIVGYDFDVSGDWRAACFNATGNGHNTKLGSLGGGNGCATAIDDSGEITGWSAARPDKSGNRNWQATQFRPRRSKTNLDIVQDEHSSGMAIGDWTALAINDENLIVGYDIYTHSSDRHVMLFNPKGGGTFSKVDLEDMQEVNSCATSINSDGVVVGYYLPTTLGTWHGIWAIVPTQSEVIFAPNGQGDDIDPNTLMDPNLGWKLKSAFTNNKGQICGNGIRPDGSTHAFLLTPVDAYIYAQATVLPHTFGPNEIRKKLSAIVTINLPEGYDVTKVDKSSIILNGILKVRSVKISKTDNNIRAKLYHRDLDYVLKPGNTELKLTGNFTDGKSFVGQDTITVSCLTLP